MSSLSSVLKNRLPGFEINKRNSVKIMTVLIWQINETYAVSEYTVQVYSNITSKE